MKKFLMILLASLVAVASFAAKKDAASSGVTQATLAEELVRSLGMASYLPADASDQDIFALLMQNGIAPKDGWQADKLVTKADLARILVQAMGASDSVANPEDDASWIAALSALGINLNGPVGETIADMEALPTVVAQDTGVTSVDPLVSEAVASGAYEHYAPFETLPGEYSELATPEPQPVPVPPAVVAHAISEAKPKPRPRPTPH